MPELPEVETVRNTLKNLILNKRIKSIDVMYDKILKNQDYLNVSVLENQVINDISRFGKYLIFILDDYYLISHLRMEGKYFIKDFNEEINKHEHVIFHLEDKDLRYHDVRKFGTMHIYKKDDDIYNLEPLNKMGIDAVSLELNQDYLYEKAKNYNKPIKGFLLDQEILSGLGNIYVDEVLFLSKFHPLKLASSLTVDDCEVLIKNIKKTLDLAIKKGGTTIRSYTSSLGVTGLFQLELNVHTKEGQSCPTCNTIIKKTRVVGRGTYYCPKCQRPTPLLIGLTGGIASGKSQVGEILKKLNIPVIDSDDVYHELVKNDKDLINDLKNNFGESILNNDGSVNLKELGKIVFNDKSLLKKLNKITHPVVISKIFEIIAQIKENNDIIVIIVPLMFESGFNKYVDYVLSIGIDESIQIERLMKRNGYTKDEALNRIHSLMSEKERNKKANFVIYNNESVLKLEENIINLLKNI